jgi:hypothetical protein
MSKSGTLTSDLEVTAEKGQFEEYRKTCSKVFGNASQSQLRYLQAFSDLQQVMWTSCESIVVKQISAMEEYSKSNQNPLQLAMPLQIYTSMTDAFMKLVSAAYDVGVVRLQLYRNTTERFNDVISHASTPKQDKETA